MKIYCIIFFFLIANLFKSVFAGDSDDNKFIFNYTHANNSKINKISNSIIRLRDPNTNLPPSHPGHPGFERVAFLYDLAVDALVLYAADKKDEAEDILDYFDQRLAIPQEEVINLADDNNIYGILKIFNYNKNKIAIGTVNAVDITSTRMQGRGILEYVTTPGPVAWAILAFLHVNPEKYLPSAIKLGQLLMAMQGEDGGVRMGDKSKDTVGIEFNNDSYSAFLMLYEITKDERWKRAADKAYDWFCKYALDSNKGIIIMGKTGDFYDRGFAVDSYSWTMLGAVGERLPLDIQEKAMEYFLSRCLVKITLPLPDGTVKELTLVDFSDPTTKDMLRIRHGFHPMGTIEWTSGVVMALQKNAVRFQKIGFTSTAHKYKVIAEILLKSCLDAYYKTVCQKQKVTLAFYATGQGIPVGPFGGINETEDGGWWSPYWYTTGKDKIRGGSLISSYGSSYLMKD